MPRWCLNASMASAAAGSNEPANKRAARRFCATVFTVLLNLLLAPAFCTLVFAADLLPAGRSDAPVSGFGASPLFPQAGSSVLPVDSAFAFSALVEAGQNAGDQHLVLMWEIQPGYYLYQKSLAAETVAGTPVTLPDLPAATTVTDEFFGTTAVYFDKLLVTIALTAEQAKPGAVLELLLTYQGCADQLYCYPPQQKNISIALPE